MRGSVSGSRLKPHSERDRRQHQSQQPPVTLNTRLSRIACRSSVAARAPSARRTATSRCRRIARTSSSPARFAQAISSTTATARNSVRISGRACSTVSSCSGRTTGRM